MKTKRSQILYKKYEKYIFASKELILNVIQKGSGSYVWDVDGNKILDLNSGQFCSIFGHSWPNLKNVIDDQMQKIWHTSTQVITPEVMLAAKKVSEICSGMNGKVIFLSTGSEAVECALRFAKHIKKRSGFLCFDTGYHGLTLGSQSVSFRGKWATPKIDFIYPIPVPMFYELNEKNLSSTINKSLKKLDNLMKTTKNKIAGLIMEPIISVGGMNLLPKDYCEGIYKLCKKYGILLVYDECQTGMGRTGKWFDYQHYNVVPDILIAAKGIGAGFPVSMVIFNNLTINQKDIQISQYSSHQNDPLSTVIVTKVIDTILENKLLNSIKEKGEYFLSQLQNLSEKYEFIKYPRGRGLMIGFDIYRKGWLSYREIGDQFSKDLLNEGVMLQSTSQGRIYRLLPNYYVSKTEIDYFINKLELVIRKYEGKS